MYGTPTFPLKLTTNYPQYIAPPIYLTQQIKLSRAEEQRLRSLMARVKLNGARFLISSFL